MIKPSSLIYFGNLENNLIYEIIFHEKQYFKVKMVKTQN